MSGAWNVPAFVSRALEAASLPAADAAMRSLLEGTVAALRASGRRWVDDPAEELLIHASPTLTVYHIALAPGVNYPPHDHRMPAMIALYEGVETNCIYRRRGAGLELVQRHDYRAPCVETLPADTIHSVLNPGRAQSAAIHVYLGDLTATRRSVWDATLRQERPFDNTYYFQQAQRS
jgi:predicted metal-dependent enzyme (double-stranded beta helix superfamily)